MPPNSSFYVDGETYDTATVTSNDHVGSATPSQAPSSMYPNGGVFSEADPDAAAASATAAAASATYAAASAANAATSATNAAASAAAAVVNTAAAVQAAAGTATPLVDGTAAVGTGTKWAHEDHVHPTDTSRAPLASPALTGTPTAPTPPGADNSTKIATTAWVTTNAPTVPPATVAPIIDGTAAVGIATKYAREDHVHPTDTSRAPLASPTFTGTPAAPTAALGTNTTQLATMAALQSQRSDLFATPLSIEASNIIINGGCDVAQEFGTTGKTLSNTAGSYFADMTLGFYNHAAATAVITAKQLAAASFPAALPGYNFGAQLKATTALASPANSDICFYRYSVEGSRVAKLAFGTSSAQSLSYGFWFYSTVSGVIFSTLQNSAVNRIYAIENTVGAGWTWCTGTIPGDTSGTWTTDTTAGMMFQVHVVGKVASPVAPGSWLTSAPGQTTNSTSLLGTANNQTIITGLVMVPGTEMPSSSRAALMVRPLAEELLLCQRYLYVVAPGVVGAPTFCGGVSGTTGYFPIVFPVPMRAAPTMSMSAAADWNVNPFSSPGTQQNGTSVAFGITSPLSTRVHLTTPSTSAPSGAMAELNVTNVGAKLFAKAQL
jgi:hypothetical protein